MANINKSELTREQIEKAMGCKTVEELMAIAKAEGYELTKDEAEAYMAELADFELDGDTLKRAAGGICWTDCPKAKDCPNLGQCEQYWFHG